MKATLETTGAGGDVISLLEALETDLLSKATMYKVMREAAKPMVKAAKSFTPKPGYPGDLPGKKPLVQTIKVWRDKHDREGVTAVIGPRAEHGWVVEHGHRIVVGGTLAHQKYKERGVKRRDWYAKVSRKTGVAGGGRAVGRTKPVHFMRKAIALTQDEVAKRFEEGMAKEMGKVVRDA